MSNYYVSATIQLRAILRDTNGTLSDPTTLTLKIRKPGAATVSYTYGAAQITRSATGIYYKDVIADVPGTWYYGFVSSGVPAQAAESKFEILSTQL